MARSVSHGNENPIYIAHPPAEISTTWNPPQKLPDTPAPHPTHGFSDTAETKHVVQERYADPDTSAHDYYGPRDPFHPRQESDFGRYSSYNDSSVTGREYEESGSSNKGEYLCGEYQNYPTPVREGIYNLASDGNRLASIFSDENPNACTIVWENRN